MSGVSFLLVGPSQMLSFPDSLVIMGIGQGMIGIFLAIMIVPGLPEMVESMLPLYPGQEREVNETSSGIFNAFLGLGQVCAPAYGSSMMLSHGFRTTTDIVAVAAVIYAVIYFIFGGGSEAFSNTFGKRDTSSATQALLTGENKSINYADETVSHAKSSVSKFGILSFNLSMPRSPAILTKHKAFKTNPRSVYGDMPKYRTSIVANSQGDQSFEVINAMNKRA